MYPTNRKFERYFKQYFTDQVNISLNPLLINSLYTDKCVLSLINDDLDGKNENENEALKFRKNVIFEAGNSIIRHYANNPFKLLHFIIESSKKNSNYQKQ